MSNAKVLGKRLQEAQRAHDYEKRQERQQNMMFRTVDRDLNTIRPDIMKLQERKKALHNQLVQLGWTAQMISDRVKEAAISESENIYGTIYAGLPDVDEDLPDDPDDATAALPPSNHISQAVFNPYVTGPEPSSPPPPPPPRGSSSSGGSNPGTPIVAIPPRTLVDSPERMSPSPLANNVRVLPPRPPPSLGTPTRKAADRPKSWVDQSPSHSSSPSYQPTPGNDKSLPRGLKSASAISQSVSSFGPCSKPEPTGKAKPHERMEAWFKEVDRNRATELLKESQNGTFLCRPSSRPAKLAHGGLHTHTIDVMYNGFKHLKVFQHNGKYGFSVPCSHKSLMELVVHFSEHSLVQHNPGLHTTLQFPVDDKI
jgi:hypothetical protein